MIAATYNCGCLIPKQSPLVAKRTESQSPCSPCCFDSFHSIVSGDKTRAVISRASRENFRKQYASSESDLKSKELDSKRAPSDKITSAIVGKGQPYKEIEAVINDNRVIIRTHKEPIKEEYDPPCECIGQDTTTKESESSLRKCEDGVSFEMANGSLELCRTPRKDASSADKSSSEKEAGCRTITLYPKADENKKPKMENPIELEENPNIFVLRIRKWCDNADKKHKIDLEFRAPRPWRSQKKKVTVK
ncbi:PREDICTED: uncharacterized protein LOC106741726 [Dinoponera quadriceps]|uniref:Uncharacterized protein LOC106741726 n=1 Tax=Dinoponera quadriceps TaxID=609295 RepID=A0A6P3WTN3_DINQU|nr:PREDICTED: uncharacterized protein LOC106741726 [Dinoponera quadriceps]